MSIYSIGYYNGTDWKSVQYKTDKDLGADIISATLTSVFSKLTTRDFLLKQLNK